DNGTVAFERGGPAPHYVTQPTREFHADGKAFAMERDMTWTATTDVLKELHVVAYNTRTLHSVSRAVALHAIDRSHGTIKIQSIGTGYHAGTPDGEKLIDLAFGKTTYALKIRPAWLQQILAGTKTVELRKKPCPTYLETHAISLMETGSRLIRGTAVVKALNYDADKTYAWTLQVLWSGYDVSTACAWLACLKSIQAVFVMTRITLVHCLEGDWGASMRQMLTAEELLVLLQLKRSLPMRNLDWALRLQADVAALRTIMASLQSTQLRFPGFCCPVTVEFGKAWTPQSSDDPLQTLGTVEHLLHWMEDFGLGGYTPSEAVLVMNAWPKTTRDVGAALSDFLTEAHAEFFY
ncbi:unnamed protein product, partial [Symbiodinium necroappetens]